MVIPRFPARTVELVMDGAYATKAWRELPDRVTVTTRMRANAACSSSPRPHRQEGTSCAEGPAPALAELAKAAVFAPVTITAPDGNWRVERVAGFSLWYGPFYTRL